MKIIRRAYAAFVLLCLLASFGVATYSRLAAAPTLRVRRGPVKVMFPGDAEWRWGKDGTKLEVGTLIDTLSNGIADVRFAGRSTLRLLPTTRARVLSFRKSLVSQHYSIELELQTGRGVYAAYGGSPAENRLVTPAGRLLLRGTETLADIGEDGHVEVSVLDGEVDLESTEDDPTIITVKSDYKGAMWPGQAPEEPAEMTDSEREALQQLVQEVNTEAEPPIQIVSAPSPSGVSAGPADEPKDTQMYFSSTEELAKADLQMSVGGQQAEVKELVQVFKPKPPVAAKTTKPGKPGKPATGKSNLYWVSFKPPKQRTDGNYDLQVAVPKKEQQAKLSSYVNYGPLAGSAGVLEQGLECLRKSQASDGSWGRGVGVTSLALLALVNAGFDDSDPAVASATQFLLNNRVVGGSGGFSNSGHAMYETSAAVTALAALNYTKYRAAIIAGRDYIVRGIQDESKNVAPNSPTYGGFIYTADRRGADLSNSQFAIFALHAAKLPQDHPVWAKAKSFVHRCQDWQESETGETTGDGGFGYTPGGGSYGSMTGAGLWALLLCGERPYSPRVKAALNWVEENYDWGTNPRKSSFYYYYVWSMSKALTLAGKSRIGGHDWYSDMVKALAAKRDRNGCWSGEQGATAMAVLALQAGGGVLAGDKPSCVEFKLTGPGRLHVYDSQGRHAGWDSLTEACGSDLPTARASADEGAQAVALFGPQGDNYRVAVEGTKPGQYSLEVVGKVGDEVKFSDSFSGDLEAGSVDESSVVLSSIAGPLTVFAEAPKRKLVLSARPVRPYLLPFFAQSYRLHLTPSAAVSAVDMELGYDADRCEVVSVEPGDMLSTEDATWERQGVDPEKEQILLRARRTGEGGPSASETHLATLKARSPTTWFFAGSTWGVFADSRLPLISAVATDPSGDERLVETRPLRVRSLALPFLLLVLLVCSPVVYWTTAAVARRKLRKRRVLGPWDRLRKCQDQIAVVQGGIRDLSQRKSQTAVEEFNRRRDELRSQLSAARAAATKATDQLRAAFANLVARRDRAQQPVQKLQQQIRDLHQAFQRREVLKVNHDKQRLELVGQLEKARKRLGAAQAEVDDFEREAKLLRIDLSPPPAPPPSAPPASTTTGPPAPPQKSPPPEAAAPTCANCGKVLKSGARFCTGCGAQQPGA